MKDLEREVYEYLRERAWDRLNPGDLAKSISIEAAELLEIFQWSNPSLDETRQNSEKLEKIKAELADVLIYCIEMSVLLGLDTTSVIREKLERVKKKYPAELMRKSAQEGSGSGNDSEYLRIKNEARRNGTN